MTYETEKSSFTSTYQTADDDDNLSIRYRNLYSINGEITYLSLDKNDSPPYVHKWTNSHDWRPKIKHFESESELKNFVNQFSDIEEIELALLNDNLWYGNIGHALFDGLYPVFLAAVKFGLEDSDFVYLADNWSNPKVLANEAIINFCGCDIRSYPNLDKDKVILFKNLVSGTGRTGNRVMNETYKLYGNQYHGLEKFKFRMLSRNGATADKPINSKFKIAIINNKRYSSKERLEIKKIIDYFSGNQQIECNFIDWSHYNFEQQMSIIQDIDIHITGPGTGMMYMPFLKRGAVNINLGYMEHTQTNTARPNIKIQDTTAEDHIFPGWMEQSVCAGTEYVSTLYYDRFRYNDIEFDYLMKLIDQSIQIINSNLILENKHNIDALIFIEYCSRVENARKLCDYLTSVALFIELFVNEHPLAVPQSLVDIELLRKIKQEFNFDRRYEINLNKSQ